MLKAVSTGEAANASPSVSEPAKDLYHRLLDESGRADADARRYLKAQLRHAQALPADLPDDPQALAAWSTQHAERVGRQYRTYLEGRRGGAQRSFFSCRAHALYFLRGVAPTKLVDGAWLYGTLAHWDDARFRPLIRTYLEELGDGVPSKNHVVLYKRLLASQGCEDWQQLDDAHYVQGAIQLALGRHAEEFLPELIGYNLGYEQLPLHLLITAYELNELGIDPYYFTLHVTVDNAASGHAHKAIQALLEMLPRVADPESFFQRVRAGYGLNELGAGTVSVIESFSLEQELHQMLAAKAAVGAQLHSDYCRIGGRTVNEWLSAPERIPEFLACLQDEGWIRRGEDPANSRFWRLVQGERAAMFGVFTGYEQQLLRDWISDAEYPRQPSFRALERRRARTLEPPPETGAREGEQARALREQLAALPDRASRMTELLERMGPAVHHTPAGLAATRLYAQLLDCE